MFYYSKSNIIALSISAAAIMLVSIFLFLLLRKKEEKIRMIPLKIITSIILLLELAKQILCVSMGDYDWWTVPLHFCSLFLYFFPLMCYAKGKVQSFGRTMSFVTSGFLTLLFYFDPTSVIGEKAQTFFVDFLSFHTFVYHHLAILFFILSLFLNVYHFDKWAFFHVFLGITIYAAVALLIGHLSQTNYCNLLYSNIPFMEQLRLSTGQVFYTFVMYFIGIVGGWGLCGVFMLFKKFAFQSKQKSVEEK